MQKEFLQGTALEVSINDFLNNSKIKSSSRENYQDYITEFAYEVNVIDRSVLLEPERIFVALDWHEIDRCLRGYITRRNTNATTSNKLVKTMEIPQKILSVVTVYLEYLSSKHYHNAALLSRLTLSDPTNIKSRKNMLDKISKDFNLTYEVKSSKAISLEKAEDLLMMFDMKISKYLNDESIAQNEYNYSIFIRTIITKLIMLVGIPCKSIGKIKFNDYFPESGNLFINGYLIPLPKNFKEQMDFYYKIRTNIECKVANEDAPLFLALDGTFKMELQNKLHDMNSHELYALLLVYSDSGRAIRPIQYRAIIEQIRQGISKSIICAVTGNGPKIYDNCLETLKEEDPSFSEIDAEYTNRLKESSIYKYMQ